MALIRAITLLHQHQREIKYLDTNAYTGSLERGPEEHRGSERTGTNQRIAYIEATEADIAVANRLAHMVLGRTLDELPPQTRTLLTLIDEWVKERCKADNIEQASLRFTRREIREATLWGNTQLKVHLKRLEELEYLIVHRGGRGQSFVYELAYQGEGKDGQPFLLGLHSMGLQELETQQYDEKKSGQDDNLSGESDTLAEWGRPAVGVMPGVSRPSDLVGNAEPVTDSGFLAAETIQDAHPSYQNKGASQINGRS